MNRFILPLLGILGSISLFAGQPANVTATLSIEPASSLPGLSVPLTITVRNEGPAVRLGPGSASGSPHPRERRSSLTGG